MVTKDMVETTLDAHHGQVGAVRQTLKAVADLTGEQFDFQLVERTMPNESGRFTINRVLQVSRKPRGLSQREKDDLLALNGGVTD